MSIRDQPANQVRHEVHWTAMPRMLNLRDVLQLVDNGFDDRAFTQKKRILTQHWLIRVHIAFELREQAQPVIAHQLLEQGFTQVPQIREELTEDARERILHHAQQPFAIINVARRELQPDDLPLVVEQQVQFEPEEPIDTGFPSSGEVLEHAMLANPSIVTDFQRGAIHEADPATPTKLSEEIRGER